MSKIPATVITGFLGAGKTTLIRHLLQNADGRRIALIINEFGDLGVDGEILKGCGDAVCSEDDIVELANGCICCTVADDFLPTMEKLLKRDNPPSHIIIETSGLALPKPLVKAFNWPEIRTKVTVDGVITLIDAAAVSEGRFASDENALMQQRAADDTLDHDTPLEELFTDQLLCADLVVLNKTDLLSDASIEAIEQDLRHQVRPSVKFLKTAHGVIDGNIVLGLAAGAEADLDARPSHHDSEDDHDHDDFESFIVDGGVIQSPEKLLAAIVEATKAHDILRVKGFCAVEGRDMRLLIQAVGPRIQHYYDRGWVSGEDRRTRLVVIGEHNFDQHAIEEALKKAMI